MTPTHDKELLERFDNFYANEWKPGHKHNENCEFICSLRGEIKAFLLTALTERDELWRKRIEALRKTGPWWVRDQKIDIAPYNAALDDLLSTQ